MIALQIKPVTAANRQAVEALQLFPAQRGFIERVDDCMREADEVAAWKPVGIYDDALLVGFAMYGYFHGDGKPGTLWLDRLLIDRRYQGKGYGRAAVGLLLERLWQEYGAQPVYLSVYDDNPVAIRLYEQLGFRFNGRLDSKGEKIMVHPTPSL